MEVIRGGFDIKLKISWLRAFLLVHDQASPDRDNSRRVRTPEKNSASSPIRHNNTKHLLCPITSQHSLEFLEIVWWELVPRGSFARTWEHSSCLFSRPDWQPLGLRGWTEFATKVRNNRLKNRWALHFCDFFFCYGSRFLFRPADQNNTKANYHVMYVGNILFKSVLNKWHNRLFSTHFKPSTRSLKNFLTSRQIRQSSYTFPKRWEFLIKTKCKSSPF